MQNRRLVVHTDYVAPACYLVEPALDVLRSEGVEVGYRPFELFPVPLPLPDYGSTAEAAAWRSSVEPVAARLGVPIAMPRRAVRTRKAHEAVIFAAAHGLADRLHRAILDAYFVHELDIARVDVLVGLGTGIGLDRTELKVTLDLDTHADAVAASRAAALAVGITGAPGFVVETVTGGPRVLLGWHDAESLRRWLEDDALTGERPGT
jgi:predicted DsbA family dithiol-disulfide isomerase